MIGGYKLVLVKWHDSFGCSSEWRETSDLVPADDYHVCYSVGWIVHETKEVIVVVPHLSPVAGCEEVGVGDMCIPHNAIVSITPLLPEEEKPHV